MDYKEALILLNNDLKEKDMHYGEGGMKRFCEEHNINYTSANEVLNEKKTYPGIVAKLLKALGYKVEYKKMFHIEIDNNQT